VRSWADQQDHWPPGKGSIEMLTDVSIKTAGNVWAAINLNDLNGDAAKTGPTRDPFLVQSVAA